MEVMAEVVPACKVKAGSIKAIDKKSVHRICSGQVVLTLATAVKELVENSIDAGATSVEIKLKEYGSECIEVIDNGNGVKEENFEGLALKHHTSKLTDFDDLVNVSTFGFRGEALSSLCALSNMVITTRHKTASVGTRLEFTMNGKILTKKITPKPVGTVVTLQNIFHTLPVRHKEFHRNLKKEFARLIQVLNAYCIINTGVRISCVNTTSKGNRTTVISTNCNTSMRDNISNVFGSKQLQSLMEFNQIDPKEDICLEYGIKLPQTTGDFSISGYVSKCEHGQGRSSSDRQFIFINKRPCDASKILKLINEVYHMYNRHQYPFVSFSIEMKKESVDVNVTPDKRQMFLDGEKLLLAVMKTSLIAVFERTSSVYKVNNTSVISTPTHENMGTKSTPLLSFLSSPLPQSSEDKLSMADSLTKLKRNFSSTFDKNKDNPSTPDVLDTNKKPRIVLNSSLLHSKRSVVEPVKEGSSTIMNYFTSVSDKKSSVVKNCDDMKNDDKILERGISESGDGINNSKNFKVKNINMEYEEMGDPNISTSVIENNGFQGAKLFRMETEKSCLPVNGCGDVVKCIEIESIKLKLSKALNKQDKTNEGNQIENNINENCEDQKPLKIMTSAAEKLCATQKKIVLCDGDCIDDGQGFKKQKKEVVVNFSLDGLRRRLKKKSKIKQSTGSSFSRAFRAKISPGDQKDAEEELSREISKDMFSKMEILGQFNLGFIIARLGADLFIVDQHATDEKYNFEMLQRNHVLQSQKMIIPQNLDLTSSNETILIDNLDVFKKNGFDFLIQPEAPPTQRIKLVSAPVSKNWSFGKDDIEELLFMLMDSPNVMCRPSRVRMMFASRACRKSIMIGTALNHNEMKRLVTHMGEIDQPWNCPHGRPTMRHLFNLNMLPS